jgi:hypothetical protein
LFYASLQGIRNFCDYTLADRVLISTGVGLGSWLIDFVAASCALTVIGGCGAVDGPTCIFSP